MHCFYRATTRKLSAKHGIAVAILSPKWVLHQTPALATSM